MHSGLFRPGVTPAAGASERVKRAPEHQEELQEPWPPVNSTDVQDGNWGPCDGRVTADYSYDTRGLLTRMIDDRGAVTLLRRDGLGRVTQATWESGRHVVNYTYDDLGNLTSSTLGITFTAGGAVQNRSFTNSTKYDARNRPYESTDGRNNTASTTYSSRGSVETVTDSRQNTTRLTPDGLGRVKRVEIPVANNPYIPSGTLTRGSDYYDSSAVRTVTEADGQNTTEWEYDTEGRPAAIKYPASQASAGQETRFRVFYDPGTGRVDRTQDAEDTTIQRHYTDGRLERLEVTAPVSPGGTGELKFEYDGDDRLVAGLDVTTGHDVRLEYESLGGVVAEQQGPYRVAYDREGESRRTILQHPAPGQFTVTYSVDKEGRTTHVRVGSRVVGRFQYRIPTRLSARFQPPLRTDYEHDDNGLLENVSVSNLASGNDIRFALVRDADGRLETCTRTQGQVSEVWAWEYDEPGRVKKETRGTDNNGAVREVITTRTFDGDDVLRKEQVQAGDGTAILSDDTVERTREERGRILSETNAPAIRYDKNGSLVQFGSEEYEYDSWHRLIRVLRGGASVAEYEYDAFDRLVRRRTPEGIEDYIYDGWHLIEVRKDGEVIERYVYSSAIDDVVYAEAGDDQYNIFSDPMGNIHALVDMQGQVVQFYRYTLRGTFEVLDSGYNSTTQAPIIRLLFQRRIWDSASGLYYFRARWYQPSLGVFLTSDPSGYSEGTEHYGLNRGDPINSTDPMGLDDESVNPGDAADDSFDLLQTLQGINSWLLNHSGSARLNPTTGALVEGLEVWDTIFRRTQTLRDSDMGPAEAFGSAWLAGLGDFFGFTPLMEAAVGVDLTEARELTGSERGIRGGLGGGQLLLSFLPIGRWAGRTRQSLQRLSSVPRTTGGIRGVLQEVVLAGSLRMPAWMRLPRLQPRVSPVAQVGDGGLFSLRAMSGQGVGTTRAGWIRYEEGLHRMDMVERIAGRFSRLTNRLRAKIDYRHVQGVGGGQVNVRTGRISIHAEAFDNSARMGGPTTRVEATIAHELAEIQLARSAMHDAPHIYADAIASTTRETSLAAQRFLRMRNAANLHQYLLHEGVSPDRASRILDQMVDEIMRAPLRRLLNW